MLSTSNGNDKSLLWEIWIHFRFLTPFTSKTSHRISFGQWILFITYQHFRKFDGWLFSTKKVPKFLFECHFFYFCAVAQKLSIYKAKFYQLTHGTLENKNRDSSDQNQENHIDWAIRCHILNVFLMVKSSPLKQSSDMHI